MNVAVVGGGVVGLCVAHALQRRGADVVVIERDRCGEGASSGNAGWVTPGLSAPVPAPGVVLQALRWMLDRDSPFLIRPRLDPAFLAWGVAFWRAGSRTRHAAGLKATLELARPTPRLFDDLRSAGVAFEMHTDGLLYLVRDGAGLDAWIAMYDALSAHGFEAGVEPLDRPALHALEPAASNAVGAGLLARVERHVRPETLMAGLVASLRAGGARFEEGHEVTAVAGTSVRTRDGAIDADAVVVAAGVWTSDLLRSLGLRIPLEGAKGYSITYPTGGPAPRRPLYLTEAKVGVSPFAGGLRLAGTLELAGRDLSVDPRRVDAMARHAGAYLRDPLPTDGARWAGLRPIVSDGLPVIGAVPHHPDVFVATGHHMLGVTLAPATGEALAPHVLGGDIPEVLRPFDPGRFARATR